MAGIPCSLYAQDSFIITRGFLDADTERMGIHNLSEPESPPVITGWGFSTYASVSWDGSRKAYFDPSQRGFYMSNIDDSDEELVYRFSEGDRSPLTFSLSPDGNKIAYVEDFTRDIKVIDLQQESNRLIVTAGQVTGHIQLFGDNYNWPRWSADGTKLVFQVDSHPHPTVSLYMVDISEDHMEDISEDQPPPVQITFPEEDLPSGHEDVRSHDIDFDWLQNSSRVLFRRLTSQGSGSSAIVRTIIYEMDMNDEKLTKKVTYDDTSPINTASQQPQYPRWSPSGDQIAVRRVVSGVIGLYVMDIEEGGFTLLYQVPHNIPGNYIISRIERWTAPLAEKEIQVNSSADRTNLAEKTNCNTGETVVVDGEVVPECTLRAAIETLNNRARADSISFNINGGGPHIITPGSPLPVAEHPVVLDATTQPGYSNHPLLTINGEGVIEYGFVLDQGESTLRGLAIGGFTEFGVVVIGPGENVLEANHIGLVASGTAAIPNLRGGVLIRDSPNNMIGGEGAARRNVISGNGPPGPPDAQSEAVGVRIAGEASTNNRVLGNYIGTDVTGMLELGNAVGGVDITDAPGNFIGGSTVGARNVIAGNGGESNGQMVGFGIGITGASATDNRIEGNYIGVAADGAAALGNGANGVAILDAGENVVGGVTPSPGTPPGNIIGGHAGPDGRGVGVAIVGNEVPTPGQAPNNRVQGNLIGTNAAGMDSLSNGTGILLNGNAHGTLVGGAEVGARNVIAGSRLHGVSITDNNRGAGPAGVRIERNFIGTNAAGTDSLSNRTGGIYVESIASPVENTTIGGTEPGAGNLIAGNRSFQVLAGAAPDGEAAVNGLRIVGNTIGLFQNGSGDYPADDAPARVGIGLLRVDGAAIGVPGSGNTISGNSIGIFLIESGENLIQGNRIGTTTSGTQRRPNGVGIHIQGSDNIIGGTTPGARNVISGNATAGINLEGRLTTPFVGSNLALESSMALAIPGKGGEAHARRGRSMLVPAIAGAGVLSRQSNGRADNNIIQGNFIGTTAGGDAPLGNGLGRDGDWKIPEVGAGIQITDTAADNLIGGLVEGARNVISGNGIGIAIWRLGPNPVTGTKVWNNFVGMGADVKTPVPNRWHGIIIVDSNGNQIGPPEEGPGNLIAYNGGAGVVVGGGGFAAIRRNIFVENDSLAIDIGGDGLTPNDGSDSGPNGAQNFPELLYAASDGIQTEIGGRIDGHDGPFAVDVYSNATCDPLFGHGQGESFLGVIDLAGGSFAELAPAVIPPDAYLTATATSASDYTSEFSACRRVVSHENLIQTIIEVDEIGTVLNDLGLTVEVTGNTEFSTAQRATAQQDISAQRLAGTLFAARYNVAPDHNTFSGEGTSDDGSAIVPDAVSATRYWSLTAYGLTGITYSACLNITSLPDAGVPGQLVVMHREHIGRPWVPLPSRLTEDGAMLCASGLTTFGEFGIGGAGVFVSNEPEPSVREEIPSIVALHQNYPNPFNPSTLISFDLPVAGYARVVIYDLMGRSVQTLADGHLSAGSHQVTFDAGRLSSGIYLYRLETEGFTTTRKMMLVK